MKKVVIASGIIFTLLFVMSVQNAVADVINACVHKSNGKVRIVGGPSDCKNSEEPLFWNDEGSTGQCDCPFSVDDYNALKDRVTLLEALICLGPEICNDGIDNDCDGDTDEGCEDCTPDQQRPCSVSSPDPNGVECNGVQTCIDNSGITEWGECVLPIDDCNDADDDCDGIVDEACEANCIEADEFITLTCGIELTISICDQPNFGCRGACVLEATCEDLETLAPDQTTDPDLEACLNSCN